MCTRTCVQKTKPNQMKPTKQTKTLYKPAINVGKATTHPQKKRLQATCTVYNAWGACTCSCLLPWKTFQDAMSLRWPKWASVDMSELCAQVEEGC